MFTAEADLAAVSAADNIEQKPQFGMELTADQWQPWDFDPLALSPQHYAVRSIPRPCRTVRPVPDTPHKD